MIIEGAGIPTTSSKEIEKTDEYKRAMEAMRKMGNMSYCRFENTYEDLDECYESMEADEKLSKSETRYRRKLIQTCINIAHDFADLIEEENEKNIP